MSAPLDRSDVDDPRAAWDAFLRSQFQNLHQFAGEEPRLQPSVELVPRVLRVEMLHI
jgi:hypothetical protein